MMNKDSVRSFLVFKGNIGLLNKGGKFQRKLWCYVGGEYYKII